MRKWRHCKFLHSVRPSPSVPRNTQITLVSSLKDLLLSAPFCTADGHTASNAPDLFLVGVLFQLKVHWQTASRRCDKVYDRITQRQDHFIPSGTRSAQVFRVSVEQHTVAPSSISSFPQRVTSTTTGCCTVRLVREMVHGRWGFFDAGLVRASSSAYTSTSSGSYAPPLIDFIFVPVDCKHFCQLRFCLVR